MAELLKGKPVAESINERMREDIKALAEKDIVPALAILRVGEKEEDISYEKSAMKRCTDVGVKVRNVILPDYIDSRSFFEELEKLNNDDSIHGILMLRPLPKSLDEKKAREMLKPEKDVDGCTDASLAGVFTNSEKGFAPCTAQAVMEILDYYNIDPAGKKATIIGRSLVIGRPVAMLLMHRNATPTICHTKTADVSAFARSADILVACSGQMESVDAKYISDGQVIIDVGINWNEEKGKLCGDVLFEDADRAAAVTPVPGGVGTVTTSVLISHVVEAAKRWEKANSKQNR